MIIPYLLATKIKNAPQTPGIYIFKDSIGNLLYVGKAINLHKRLLHYTKDKDEVLEKTALFLSQAQRLDWIEVESDLEAILLEMNLIRTLKPKYNILSKDDKRPLLIHITNDPCPRVRSARQAQSNHGDYFGPFPSGYKIKSLLRQLRTIFPYCSCSPRRRYPCLFVDLGLCNPCPVEGTTLSNGRLPLPLLQQKQYRRNIRRLKLFLSGKVKTVKKQLERDMKRYAEKLAYEKADQVKTKLQAIEDLLLNSKHSISHYFSDQTIHDHLRRKQLETLIQFLDHYYPHSNLNLPKEHVFRIEGYDIANTSGTNATAAMVVFENGFPNTSEYRKFKITDIEGPNDPLMMYQVLQRRSTHEEWRAPDLVLIDGGKTQVGAALKALSNYSHAPMVMGLAKRFEQLVIPLQPQEKTHRIQFQMITLPLDTPFLILLRAVRDEAHRFGTTYHKKLRAKGMLKVS